MVQLMWLQLLILQGCWHYRGAKQGMGSSSSSGGCPRKALSQQHQPMQTFSLCCHSRRLLLLMAVLEAVGGSMVRVLLCSRVLLLLRVRVRVRRLAVRALQSSQQRGNASSDCAALLA
jgi:hypothetical protein